MSSEPQLSKLPLSPLKWANLRIPLTSMSFYPAGKHSTESHLFTLHSDDISTEVCGSVGEQPGPPNNNLCSFTVLSLIFAPHFSVPANHRACLLWLCIDGGLNSPCSHLPPVNISLAFSCTQPPAAPLARLMLLLTATGPSHPQSSS